MDTGIGYIETSGPVHAPRPYARDACPHSHRLRGTQALAEDDDGAPGRLPARRAAAGKAGDDPLEQISGAVRRGRNGPRPRLRARHGARASAPERDPRAEAD